MRTAYLERTIFWVLPIGVLAASFAGICVMTGTAWPWREVVHEDGQRTLLATVFYFEHAARELLPDLLLALAVAGAARIFFPPDADSVGAIRWRLGLSGVVAAVVAIIIGGTFWTEGGPALIDNLSQSHTRPGAPLVWGAHWRYHLIERFAQLLLAFSVAGMVWLRHGKRDARRSPGRSRFFGAAFLLFGAATFAFGLTTEPFRDPAYLGHQLRELFTHGLVTFPLAMGVCVELARRFSTPGGTRSNEGTWPIVLTGVAGVLCGAFLLVASVMADAQSHGQAAGLPALLFPHFAEHALGYVLVPALAGALYLAGAGRRLTSDLP
jgi:hypothetical protein